MNALCYKTVFSKRLGALVAVGEHATSQSKGQGAGTASGAWDLGSMLRYVGVLTGVFAAASMAWSQTLPQGGRVSQGQVTISQSGQQMDITQSTSKAVVNWDSFDIGTHVKVNVVQPNSQSVLLNRVLSDNPTQILGQLQANGQVVLVNPKGIVVGSDGSVSASAFTTSTLNISDADFMAGNGRYTREGSTGEVINRGRIQVAPGGYVALLGARVSNEGQIIAPQGAVALGAAETVTVPIGRTGKIKLALSPSSINASVANQKGGLIVAEGGQVYLQAAAIPSALASIVHSGRIDTSAAKAGAVHLLADGGHIRVDGQITANSTGRDPQNQPQPGGDIYIGRDKDSNVLAAVGDVSGAKLESQGGFVETSGQYLRTTDTRVLAKDWLLDPTDIKIVATNTATADTRTVTASGTLTAQDNTGILASEVLKSTIENAINSGTNVTVSTANPTTGADGSGNITIETPLSFNNTGPQAATFRLFAVNGITQNPGASITATGSQAVNIQLVGEGRYQGVAASSASSRGVDLNSTVSGNGNITITGTSRNTNSGFNGVYIANAVTTSAGTVQITGTASDAGGGAGAVIQGTVTASGNVTLDGRTANTSNRQGLVIQNTMSSTQGDIQVVGQTLANTQRAVAITNNGTTSVGKLEVSDGKTITIQANTLLVNTDSTIQAGATGTVNIQTLTSGNEIQVGAEDTLSSTLASQKLGLSNAELNRITSGQVVIGNIASTGPINVTTATTTAAGTGNLTLRTGGTINVNTALTAAANLTLQTNGGKIANSATVSGVNVSIDNTNGTIDTATGAITVGSANSVSAAAIEASGNITASGNLNLMGVSTNNAGIQVNNRVLSGANIQATGRVNNGGYGVLLNAGSSISSTASSGTSLVKGINTAGGSNALISGAGVTFSAATGSTLTVWGDGTNTGDRATRIDGGAITNGAVTIKGTSNNNTGLIVINGRIRANANSALTLEGTTSAAGQTGVYFVNSGGVEMSNGSTLQITGQNTATTGTGRGVSLQGSGITKVSGATTTGNVSITGTASSTAAAIGAAIEATVTTDGNITIDGTVGAAAGTGVTISGTVSSAGSAKSIQVTSNQGISHTGSLNVTGNTGTSSTIQLTSTLSGLTGTGTIGNTTSKNASVTVTQAGTSTFNGAVNAANFTKSGAGALTLNSWTHTTPATTNISNAYTVSSGSLTLSPSSSYPALNPASVNVVNNATFSLGSSSNGTWKNTAFNFTGGLGGGTMNLLGNPIGDINTTNTFSTSGGATNTINGGLNANNANVTFSLATASSGTTLHDGSFAALVFPSNSQGGFGLSNVGTLNIGGSGGVLFKDKLSASTINVNAGTLQMGDGTAATTAATADLTANQVAIGSNAKVIFQRDEATTSSTVFSGSGELQQAGAGTLTLTGNSSAFAGTTTVHNARSLAIGTGGSLGAAGSSLVLSNASASVAFTNTSGTSTIGSTISGAGSLSKSGAGTGVITADNTYSGTTTVSGGTLQVGNAGSTGTLGSGNVTLSNNANLHILRAADTTVSNTISGAGHVSASITGTGSDLSVTGPVSLTGGTVNLVADGNLSVQQAIGTSNTTDAAIVLTAGKPTNAGTSSGGDVSMSGSGSLSTGTGGRATIYTGSLSGSTGLGITAGNNRYNSDESSTNYSAALGSGTYAIYREKPTITVLVNDASKTYDGVAFNGGSLNTTLSSGTLARSDSFTAVTANATLGGASQGAKNAGQYAITASETGGKNALGYEVTYTSGQLTINQADLTVTANSATKTYDGNTSATGAGTVGTLAGAAAGDVVNSSGSQAFLTSSAGSNKTVRASGVTIKNSANADMTGNYNIIYTDNLTSTISKKDVTLESITAAHKSYDGNDTATISAGVISGTVASETLLISGSGSFDTKDVANDKTVTVSDVTTLTKTNGTGAWGNYNLTTTGAKTATANITKKEVTLSSITAAHKTYDGSTTATITSGSISGTVGSETLAISGSGSFDNKNVANGKTVTVSDVTTLTKADGTGSWSNYSLATGSKTTTANITKKDVTLSSITAAHKTYDGNNSATISAGSISGTVGTETLLISGSGTFDNKDAANGKTVTVSDVTTLTKADGTGAWSNYNLTTTGDQTTTANITKKEVTLDSITAEHKTYNGNTTATITSGSISGTVGSETLAISGSGTFDNKNVANNRTVTVADATTLTQTDGTGSWSNYNLTTTGSKTTTANITKADLTVTANSVTKTYDGTTKATGTGTVGTLAGAASGDMVSSAGSQAFLSSGAGNNKTVRASGVTIKDAANADMTDNYNITYTDNTTGVIQKANLTLTANDDARFVGLTDTPGFTGVSPTGLVNGEDMSVLGGTLSITRTNASTLAAGTYAEVLSPTGLTSENYEISYVKGTYTIVPANQLLIRNDNISSTYGSTWSYAPTAKYLDGSNNTIITLSRTGSGNSFTFSDGLGTTVSATLNPYSGTSVANTSSAGHTVVGSYKIKDASPSVVGRNFVGDPVFVGTLNVNTKALTPTVSGTSKVYNGSTAMNNLAMDLTGKEGVDTVSIQGTGTYTQKHVGTNLNYTIANLALSGTDAANYHIGGGISSITGNDGTITPATLKLSTSNVSKTYDGNTSASGTTIATQNTQLFGNDSLSGGTFAFSNPNASSGDKVVQVSAVTVNDGNNGQNYSVSYVDNTTSTISKKNVTLGSITAAHKTYDGSATATITSGSISGTVGSETLGISGSGNFDDKNVANSKTVTVSDVTTLTQTDGTGSWINYNLTTTGAKTATANITPAAASISAPATSVIYNGQTQYQGQAERRGFVDGDNVQAIGLASGRNAGSYASSLSATGADVGNYTITYNNAALTIDKRPASLSALGQTVVYNGQTQSLTGTPPSGFVAGDALTFGGLPSGRNVGQYTSAMTVSGADAANYDVTLGSATLTITPKGASVTARPERVTYNGQTQQQSPAVLDGFVAGDDIQISGLASGRNAGVYGSNMLASGQDVPNYSIRYEQGALTIDKAPLQFVGTSVADKVYDGNTQARVTPGTLSGLVGTETLNIDAVQGQFDSPEIGFAKPVQVIYGLSDGANGGLVSNYQWSPVTVQANITGSTTEHAPAPERIRQVNPFSRLSYLGFGGLVRTGATTGQLFYAIQNKDTRTCSPLQLEGCICDQAQEQSLQVCYPADLAQQAGN